MTASDCYEKGHTPAGHPRCCAKCGERLVAYVVVNGEVRVWHTQAELDRLWEGVDREATKALTTEEGQ